MKKTRKEKIEDFFKNGVEGEDYIVCRICGEKFTKIDSRHLHKHNITFKEYKEKYGDCTMCNSLRRQYANCKLGKSNADIFLEKAKKIHEGENLDYSKVQYVNSETKVCIIDPVFGEYWQTPTNHLKGQAHENWCKMTTEEFIKRAKASYHREEYDYSKVNYVNSTTKVCIIDPIYGEFWQNPINHLNGDGHPSRHKEHSSETQRFTTDQIIEKFKEVHSNEKLDYSQVEYKGMDVAVKIICRELDENGNEYGEFWQTPRVHLRGCSHQRLGIDKQKKQIIKTQEQFIAECKAMYPDGHYSFDKVIYKGVREKVIITCNKIGTNGKPHGDFEITPEAFLYAHEGCSTCGHISSKAEIEIYNYICSLIGEDKILKRDRTIIEPYELDIYIPSKHIAIEYNGIIWHSDKFKKYDKNYHLNKTIKCNEQGIALIHIFEDEYMNHKELVLDKIANMLDCNKDHEKIMARKCEVREININEARNFLNINHIQGYAASTVYIGAYYNGKVVGVMTFKKETKDGNDWNLNRFATDIHYRCQGMASKMFLYFVKKYKPDTVKSFLDRCWVNINKPTLYDRLGFKMDSIEAPDYKYTKNGFKRYHKFGFRKQILHKKYGLSLDMTEKEMTESLGYYRIYDCGHLKYIWTNPNKKEEED